MIAARQVSRVVVPVSRELLMWETGVSDPSELWVRNPGLGDFEGGKINPTTTSQSNLLTKKWMSPQAACRSSQSHLVQGCISHPKLPGGVGGEGDILKSGC